MTPDDPTVADTDVEGNDTTRTDTAGQDTDTTRTDTTGQDIEANETNEAELDLAARIEVLAEENRRLRVEYARARQAQYRRTAAGLGVIGILAVVGGLLFPAGREVLFALGATGLFGAVLTLYLTPGRFVSADTGDRVYTAMSRNLAAIVAELGLSDTRVYLPPEDDSAWLYVPQRSEWSPPADRSGPIVVDEDHRGLLLDATGAPLLSAFERALTGDLGETPDRLASQLADGVVEQFELAEVVEPEVAGDDGRVTFGVGGSAFGDLDRIDHPIVSFVAVGLAVGLGRPVAVEVAPGDERVDWLVTCRWEPSDED